MSAHKKPSAKQLQAICDRFNARCPVGGRVEYVAVLGGAPKVTTTRSEAYILSGHSAVVMLVGVSGSYHLTHVTPAPFDEELVLSADPFADDVSGPGDRVLRDKIVTARKEAHCENAEQDTCCSNLAPAIQPGQRVRSMVGLFCGALYAYKWCQACCCRLASEQDGKADHKHG